MSPVPEPCASGSGGTPYDWEVNQLCDVDVDGNVIATVTQIFQWDEATQGVVVSLKAAADPSGPDYVVVGTLQNCSSENVTVSGTVSVDNFPASVEISNDAGNAIPISGTVNIDSEVSTSFLHGQNTDIDSGADEQIVVASNPSKHGVIVKALPGNNGTIYVGLAGVTTATGFPLDAGETVTIPVDDANKVYARSDINNQGLAWIA